MKLHTINTGNLKLDGGAMFGVVPKSLWSKKYPADENNLCNWSMRCLLVEDGDRKILIDNGFGDKQDEKFTKHFHLNGDDTLESSLANLGLSTDDITDVLLTHLHFDHCGGSIKYNDDRSKLIPAFKNATYWTSEIQWEWAIHPNRREKPSFLKENIFPIKESGQLRFIEKEGELFPNISVRFYNGHTEGQVIPFIKYKGKTVVYVADLLPSAAHIPLAWILAYDMQPLVTLAEKEAFLTEAAENDYVLFLEHDLFHECCTVEMTDRGVRESDTFSLGEYFEG